MSAEKMSRRSFIKKTVLGGTGLAVGGVTFLKGNRVLGANDRIHLAIIGPGSRGRDLMGDFFEYSQDLNLEMVAVCDLWKYHRELGGQLVLEKTGTMPRLCRNTDELYKMKDLDAVIIATADFQHTLMCEEAVRAGKDVYVEKPLANNFEDAVSVRKAVKESDRVVQIGTQRRSDGKYISATEFIRSGAFGKIIMVEMHWNVNQPDRWRRQELVPLLKEEDTDWKRYLLDRPYQPFDARKYLEFRLYWPFSSGLPCQWLSHQIDTVAWFADDPYPESVVALGGIYQWHDDRENPDTFSAVFKYPKGFQVNYTARQTNDYGGTKEIYLSNLGSLETGSWKLSGEGGRDGIRVSGKAGNLLEEEYVDEEGRTRKRPTYEILETSAQGIHHMRNWLECLRSRKTPNADIEAGYSHSVALCMAIQALHTGKRITFDAENHRILEA